MNLKKSELRMLFAQEVGKHLEAREEGTRAEVERLHGSMGALKQAWEKLNAHKEHYKKDLEEEKLTVEEVNLCMKVVDHCLGILQNLNDTAMVNRQIKQGALQEIKAELDYIEKMYSEERKKVEAFQEALARGDIKPEQIEKDADGNPVLRVIGGRVTNDAAADLAQRRAEARARKQAASEPPAAPAAAEPATAEPAAEPVAEAKPESEPSAAEPATSAAPVVTEASEAPAEVQEAPQTTETKGKKKSGTSFPLFGSRK